MFRAAFKWPGSGRECLRVVCEMDSWFGVSVNGVVVLCGLLALYSNAMRGLTHSTSRESILSMGKCG